MADDLPPPPPGVTFKPAGDLPPPPPGVTFAPSSDTSTAPAPATTDPVQRRLDELAERTRGATGGTAAGVLESATDPYGFLYGTGRALTGMGVAGGQILKNRLAPGLGQWLREHPTLQRAATAVKDWTMAPSETGTEIAGGAIGPALVAPETKIPGVARALEAVPGFVRGGVQGATYGGLTPTKSGTGQEHGAALGAAAGTVLGAGGQAARYVGGKAAERAAEVAGREARTGQLEGDYQRARDELATALRSYRASPRPGSLATLSEAQAGREAQEAGVRQFNDQHASYIMEPTGQAVPASTGPARVAAMRQTITDGLNNANAQLSLPRTQAFVNNLVAIKQGLSGQFDTPQLSSEFDRIFDRTVPAALRSGGWSGPQFARMISSLDGEAEQIARGAPRDANPAARYRLAQSLRRVSSWLEGQTIGDPAAKAARARFRESYGRWAEFQGEADTMTGLAEPGAILEQRRRRTGTGFWNPRSPERAARNETLRQSHGDIEAAAAAARRGAEAGNRAQRGIAEAERAHRAGQVDTRRATKDEAGRTLREHKQTVREKERDEAAARRTRAWLTLGLSRLLGLPMHGFHGLAHHAIRHGQVPAGMLPSGPPGPSIAPAVAGTVAGEATEEQR